MKFYSITSKMNKSTMAFALNGIRFYDKPASGTEVTQWNRIEFELKENKFADLQACNVGWELCSMKLKNIIEKMKTAEDKITWLPVYIKFEDEVREYYLLHHVQTFDVIDRDQTSFELYGKFGFKPVLNSSLCNNHNVFMINYCGDIYISCTFISNDVRKEIVKEKCIGIGFYEALQSDYDIKKPKLKKRKIIKENRHVKLIKEVVKASKSVKDGMDSLVSYCESVKLNPAWSKIRALDYAPTISCCMKCMFDVLDKNPPKISVSAYYFGIFTSKINKVGDEGLLIYISGSDEYEENIDDEGDWACDPVYFPEGRYFPTLSLIEIYNILKDEEDEEIFNLGMNILVLGYAALFAKELLQNTSIKMTLGNRESRAVAVGFDSGEIILIGNLYNDGFHIT